MITVSRLLLRNVRAALRRTGLHKPSTTTFPIAFIGAPDGLRIQAYSYDAAIEYHQPAALGTEEILVPQQFLDDCEGRKDEDVTLELQANGRVTAQWREGSVPQLTQYDQQHRPAGLSFPSRPKTMTSNEPALLAALAVAFDVTEREPVRYALDCVRFSGQAGTIAATDGRQLLIQSGFRFPWKADLLVPASRFFSFSELPTDQGCCRPERPLVRAGGRSLDHLVADQRGGAISQGRRTRA